MLNQLKLETNVTYTENGAKTHKTTNSDVLDMFAQAGALRNRNESDIISIFSKAFAEDRLLAIKSVFYFRDVREGQGERRTFRVLLKYLANTYPEIILKNLELIPFYGRWDDLYELVGTKIETEMFNFMKKQLEQDINSDHPSLIAKWLKSENTSSKDSVMLAKKTRIALKYSPKEYRKILSSLRKKIDVVERLMSSKRWEDIEYSKVPSKASMIYRNAFLRNDEDRYSEFLNKVNNGESKINANVLFPYELVRKVGQGEDDQVLDLLWRNLPDYIEGAQENSIAVVDVSGSMEGLPMDVAVSVGMYLAESNKGWFHNHFITFSNSPELVEIKGKTLSEKVRYIQSANWGMNTNIEAVFNLILNTAIKHKIPQTEMIQKLYIISDMEFDAADGRADTILFKAIQRKFEINGYNMPQIVFWNVDARNSQFPMTMNDYGVQMVSGCSPSIFTNLMKGNFLSAYDLMIDVLNSERYEPVKI